MIKDQLYNIMSKVGNEQILSNIYYDLERCYGSAKSLYEQAKEEGAVFYARRGQKFYLGK